jgi:hypothetical protein
LILFYLENEKFVIVEITISLPVTVGGASNGTSGADADHLNLPAGLSLDSNGSVYVADYNNNRVVQFQEGSLAGSVVAGTGVTGSALTQLDGPFGVLVDKSLNMLVVDSYNCRLMFWRRNSSFGIPLAGTGASTSALSGLYIPFEVVIDSVKNLYISDTYNHRIMRWAINSTNGTNGTLIVGTGVAGNRSHELNRPTGLFLDQNNSFLYIADTLNHRVQRFHLYGGDGNMTTVAGGNGQGSGAHQLNTPRGIYISNKTGSIYIADSSNHRIQLWNPAQTSGVTIAGVTGVFGTNSTLLKGPKDVVLNEDETFLYVSDTGNNRIQRFPLN